MYKYLYIYLRKRVIMLLSRVQLAHKPLLFAFQELVNLHFVRTERIYIRYG